MQYLDKLVDMHSFVVEDSEDGTLVPKLAGI